MTPECIKKTMMKAFADLKLDCYNEILRIKKPSESAFRACQMLCKLVQSFRGSSKNNNDSQFTDWKSIQEFVHQSPNVVKFNQEITQLIQHMICSQDYLKQLKSNQLKNHVCKLQRLQSEYFGMDSHSKVLKHFQTNKFMQILANLVFTVTRYVLFQSGKTDFINIGTVPKDQDDGDNKSCKSFVSNMKSVASMRAMPKTPVTKSRKRTTPMVSANKTPNQNWYMEKSPIRSAQKSASRPSRQGKKRSPQAKKILSQYRSATNLINNEDQASTKSNHLYERLLMKQ